ncbi:MAG TPA: type II toxin-antitoxin system prevent-host-death family antitoxin [Rhodanobacteraceae bacterium]|nr:type II toxin-antitoxin system prevent-host-death family antitoxin [Rhodanobacteraceae bacterium]
MTDQTVSVREAKARLSELAERAADGVDIVIAKHGRPAARLTTVRRTRKPVDLEKLQALTRAMPTQPENASLAIRRMRDQSRY